MAARTLESEAIPATARTWAKTAQTRQQILDAASEVFLEHGFADASIAHVVERSGFSVGSIYHHFGGKAELFTGLYLTHQDGFVGAAKAAVAAARAGGEQDGLELFMAGARAYLEAAWRHRAVARLFLSDPGPTGFASMRRARSKAWIRQNAQLLDARDDAVGRVRVSIMTAVIGDAAREISLCDARREAKAMIEASLEFLRRIAV